jgi:hypothetical protein
MSVSHPTSRDVYARRPVPGGVPSLSGIEFSLCAIRQQMSSSWAGTEVMRDLELVISDVRKLMPGQRQV